MSGTFAFGRRRISRAHQRNVRDTRPKVRPAHQHLCVAGAGPMVFPIPILWWRESCWVRRGDGLGS